MPFLALFLPVMEIKDRIRLIMEEQHMTQKVFAEFLQQSPATLSSIFNGRTSPTLNVVDAIKAKIPDISIEWLLYGTGDMMIAHPSEISASHQGANYENREPMLNFENPQANNSLFSPNGASSSSLNGSKSGFSQGVNNTHPENHHEDIKIVEKDPRKVTEIRVYYDDQTYETFVPAKKS